MEPRHMKSSTVTYRDRVTPVMLGDHVEVRIWFRRHRGRVIYVPGASAVNRHMERDGLTWVGIRLEEGGFMGALVDPHAGYLRTKVTFVEHDSQGIAQLEPGSNPYGEDAFLAP
jgi:hypothetical protein